MHLVGDGLSVQQNILARIASGSNEVFLLSRWGILGSPLEAGWNGNPTPPCPVAMWESHGYLEAQKPPTLETALTSTRCTLRLSNASDSRKTATRAA